MTKKIFLLSVVASLAFFGAGCFKLGPRIVKAPDKNQVQIAKSEGKTPNKTAAPLDQTKYENSSGNALAYLKLEDPSAADVARGGSRFSGVDGLELASGDEVSVTTGTAYIIYPEAGASRLEAGTDLVLLAGAEDGMFMQLELMAGRVWTRLEKLLGPSESYAVEGNGVVATVRGTSFGMELKGDAVDVQVADHKVEISPSAIMDPVVDAKKYITVLAGEGVRLAARQLTTTDPATLKTLVRRLSIGERMASGYLFGIRKLDSALMLRPVQPIRLRATPAVPERFKDKAQYLQFLRLLDSRATTTFSAPDRGVIPGEIATSTQTPTIQGPTTIK